MAQRLRTQRLRMCRTILPSLKPIWERPAMLEIKDLRTLHGRKIEALKGVSLKLNPGEIVTLIGANGAGKITLLKSIAGLLPTDSGEIWFEGQMIKHKPPHQIVALGIVYVPEGRRVFPRLTVLENLHMG